MMRVVEEDDNVLEIKVQKKESQNKTSLPKKESQKALSTPINKLSTPVDKKNTNKLSTPINIRPLPFNNYAFNNPYVNNKLTTPYINQETPNVNGINLGKTVANTLVQVGKGVVKSPEKGVLDPLLQLGSSKLNPMMQLTDKNKPIGTRIWDAGKVLVSDLISTNPLTAWLGSKLRDTVSDSDEFKQKQKIAEEIIAKEPMEDFINNQLGYGRVLSNGSTVQEEIDRNSLVKSTNLGGQIAESIGSMLPSVMIGNAGAGEAGSLLYNAIGSYGSGIEEAYQNGANRKQANLYGLGNAAVETATELITGGVPGVKSKFFSGLDNLVAKGLGKETLEAVSKNITQALIQSGYKILGEGFEEALSEMINPHLKNATYSEGEKINWENVLNSAIGGMIAGGFLNLPNDAVDIRNAGKIAKSISNGGVDMSIVNNDTNVNNNVDSDPGFINGGSKKMLVVDKDESINTNNKQDIINSQVITEPTAPTLATNEIKTVNYINEQNLNNSQADSIKQKQLDIIIKNNPAEDGYHTWIRDVNDIKTLEETLQDGDWKDYDKFNPDYTKDMANKAIKTGKMTVYSSYPIKQGAFISPSKMEAESYSGDGKVYSKEVNINDVAWIDPTQGQYAKVKETKAEGATTPFKEQMDVIGNRMKPVQEILPSAIKELASTKAAPQLASSIDNISNKGYNNINEGDINVQKSGKGKNDKAVRGNGSVGSIPGVKQTVQPSNENEGTRRKYSNKEYEAFEKSTQSKKVIPSKEQKELAVKAKGQHGKKVVFFDDSNSTYGAGASKKDFDTIYIGKNLAKAAGADFVYGHELMESIILKNKDLSSDLIKPTIKEILNDTGFEATKTSFLEGFDEGDIPSDYLIAKDILCDRFSFLLTGKDPGYKNELSRLINDAMDYNLNQMYKELYNKDLLSKDQSFFTAKGAVDNAPVVSKKRLPAKSDKSNLSSLQEHTFAKTPEARDIQDIIRTVDLTYEIKTNKETVSNAMTKLKRNFTKEYERIIDGGENLQTAEDTTMAGVIFKTLSKNAQATKNYDQLLEFIQTVRPKATELGQAVQAFNTWKLETPEDAIWQTQKLIDSANKELLGKKLFGKKYQELKLTPKDVEYLLNKGQEISKLPKGRQRDIEMANLKEYVNNKIPTNLRTMFKGFIRTSIMSSPSTGTTNALANIINVLAENAKQPLSALVDIGVSKITGKRTTTFLPNLKAQGVGAVAGAKRQFGDLFYGATEVIKKARKEGRISARDLITLFKSIDTSQEFSSTKDLTRGNKLGTQFKSQNKVLNTLLAPFRKLEDISKFFVRDDIFYEAFKEERIKELKKLNPGTSNDDIELEAEAYAADQVFQGKSWDKTTMSGSIAQLATKKLGEIPIIGDIAMPLTRTGGNIVTRMTDYFPPTGFAKSFGQIARAGFRDFDQKRFVDTIGRAGLGTILLVLGGNLFKNGLLTPEYEKNKKVRELQTTTGYQATSIKIGNTYIDVSKYQPISGILLIGAGLAKQEQENSQGLTAKSIFNGTISGLNTILNASPFKGVKDFQISMMDSEKGMAGAVVDTTLKLPSMLIPNIIKRPTLATDPYKRETYSSNPAQQKVNETISQIPGASGKLPSKLDIYGQPIDRTNGDMNIVGALLNPVITSKEKDNKVSSELLKIYNETKDTKFLPKAMQKSIEIDGKTVDLTTEQYQQYQKIIGNTVYTNLSKMIETSDYKNLTTEEKQYAITKVNEYAYAKAKEEVSNIEMEKEYKNVGDIAPSTYYLHKARVSTIAEGAKGLKEGAKEKLVLNYLLGKDLKDNEIEVLYKSAGYDKDLQPMKDANIPLRQYFELQRNTSLLTSNDDPESNIKGKVISGSKKEKVIYQIQRLNTTKINKLMLYAMEGYSLSSDEKTEIFNYVNKLNITVEKKKKIIEEMDNFKWLEDGRLKAW